MNLNIEDLTENDKKELLKFFFESFEGIYFSEIFEKEDYTLLFNDLVEDNYYNYVAPIKTNLNKVLKEVKPKFEKRDRKLAFYLPEFSLINEKFEIPENFSLWATDSWLVLTNDDKFRSYDQSENITVRLIKREDKEDLENYCEVFHNAYSGGPEDPYGELPESYTQCMRRSFKNSKPEFEKFYVLAEINGEAAGVALMIVKGDTAGIYSLGTKREQRDKGVGTSIMKFLIEKALDKNVEKVFLQTEKDSRVDEWYKGMGFERAFLARYYVKEDD